MPEPTFTPQPYPLFAATAETADNPLRLEPSLVPVRIVLGWIVQDGLPRPVLDGSPSLAIWTGAISYHETREQAEAFAKKLDKAARSEIRGHEFTELVRKLTGGRLDLGPDT